MAFLNPATILEGVPIKKGERVADFGSGSGFYSAEVAKKVGDEGKVMAFDVVPEALEATRSKAREHGVSGIVETSRTNLEKPGSTGLADASVDGVIVANILFQSKTKVNILREAGRIIKRGGWLLVVELDTSSPLAPDRAKLVSQQEVKTLLIDQMKFNLNQTAKPDAHHWSMLFTKV